MKIQKNIPLAPFTTFGIGGDARFFAGAQSVDELREAFAFAKEKDFPIFILGGGSNVLIDDAGFPGLVIKIKTQGVEEEGGTLIAAAGESWDALVQRAVGLSLWGIENLSGIPGTLGGAVVQNIGAYGQALSQTLAWAQVLDLQTNEVKTLNNDACAFGYRDSIFKREEGRYIIMRAALQLSPQAKPDLSYKDLAQHFSGRDPSLKEVREAVIAIRKNKFPDLSQEGTAGSFFKNPIVSEEEGAILLKRYPGLPLFAMPEVAGIKVPLAWLLDHVLHAHGMQVGNARLFERQPLVIAVKKGSSADDIKKLAQQVQEKVKEVCGIDIEPEVKIL
jgi:UDP-N-acetylmuramate dehydrogenase